MRRIAKLDVPDSGMKSECTHVCVYRLDDVEDGEKRYCNTPLKLFRASKAKEAAWSTSAALGHFKKKHEGSSSARKQKVGLAKRQTRLGECMHAFGSEGIQSISSKKNTFGLSDNEKVLSAIARWGTYASMKVSQSAFGDPLFDLHVSLKAEEIRMLVMLRMNREFMEYMRASYPDPERYSRLFPSLGQG